jgi:holin (3TMs family)
MNFLSVLTNFLKPAVDAVFRWKEGQDKMEISRQEFELMKSKLDADIQVRLAEELRKPDSEFRDFMLSYEGKSEDQTPFMRSLRSSVRPVITYWALVIITIIMFGWVSGEILQKNLGAVPKELWEIFLAIFGFWFGGRAIQQIAESWKKGDADAQAELNKGQVDLKKLELEKLKMEKDESSPAAGAAPAAKPRKMPWEDQVW